MPSFPFDREFLPVVKVDEYVNVYGRKITPAPSLLQVTGVEAIQPFYIDILQISGALPTGVTVLATNGSNNDRTGWIVEPTSKNFLQVDDNQFAQYRVICVDDILLALASPGQASPMYATGVAQTFIQRPLPQHKARVRITTAPGTDTLIWANSSNNDIAGQISGQTPTRKSRLIGLAIYSSGASVINFADGNVAGGTLATDANALFSINMATQDFIFLNEKQLPNMELTNGLVCQQDSAVNTTIMAVIQEDAVGLFAGLLLDEARPFDTQQTEFYVYQDFVPSIRAINPLNVTQSTARIMLGGWQYTVKSADKSKIPTGTKVTNIPVGALLHGELPK